MLVVLIVFMLVQYLRLILKEEKHLAESFGKEYSAYQKVVPRLFPGAAALLKKDLTEYFPLRLRWIRREASSILIVPLVSAGFECWRNSQLYTPSFALAEYAGFLLLVGFFMLLVIILINQTI